MLLEFLSTIPVDVVKVKSYMKCMLKCMSIEYCNWLSIQYFHGPLLQVKNICTMLDNISNSDCKAGLALKMRP